MYLITTTQRCGSTWLTGMLEQMTGTAARYVDGLVCGFRLREPSAGTAAGEFGEMLRAESGARVFKTHDVPSWEFDAVCAAVPGLRVLTVSRDFKDVAVSRYFYYRYYWPGDPSLGPLPRHLAECFAGLAGLSDAESLGRLVRHAVLREWAQEWAAFEGDFASENVLRVRYAGLLDGSERAALEAFTGEPLPPVDSFAETQEAESAATGREGARLFHRRGQCGAWREWLTAAQGAEMDALAAAHLCGAQSDEIG